MIGLATQVAQPGAGAVLYAFSLGLVAALNPCGLPMLPAYLALFSAGRGGTGARVARSLLSGAGVTAGFVVVFGVLGLVGSGVSLVAGWVPWLMVVVALAMCAAGVLALVGRGPSLRLPAPRVRPGRSALAMGAYGAAYAVGSLTCSLPLFLAAVGGSFARGGTWAGLSTYLAYALGMGLFVTAAAVATTTLGATALRGVRSAGRWLPIFSGLVLTASGVYLLYSWVSDLSDPTGSSPVLRAVGRLQVDLTSAVDADPARSALVLGAVVLAAVMVVVRHHLNAPGSSEGGPDS